MPADFEWQTEEKAEWTNEMEAGGETAVPLIQRRWFRPLLAAGLTLILAGSVVLWQLNRRAKAATNAIEADVIASYDLMATAAARKDVELFRSLHLNNGRHTSWGHSLDRLMADDNELLNGRRPGLIPLTASPQIADVSLAPDLTRADLVTAQSYAVQTAAHVTETITLNWTYTYQLQEDGRWLLAAPDDAFWGEWRTYESQRLLLSYPARDETVSLKIAAALDKDLAQLCGWSAALPTLSPCPDEMQIQLLLSPAIGNLAVLEQVTNRMILYNQLNNNPVINMPAPTLLGTPAGEMGEKIVLDLYVRQTMTEVIRKVFHESETSNWYRFAGYNQASLNRFLAAMQMIAWPPPNIPASDPGPPPVPWPAQAVALTCLDESGQSAALFQVRPENGQWATILAEEGLVDVEMWPGGYAFGQYPRGLESSWAIFEPDGTSFPVPATDEPVEFMYRDGRYLVAPVPPPEKYTPYSRYYALDWAQCLQGDCHWRDLPGRPIWSPDESQLLLQAWQENEWVSQILYGARLDGPFELIAAGDGPIWLDEETTGYRSVDFPNESAAELVAVPVGGEPETLLTSADLEAVLPPKEEGDSYWFYLVAEESDLLLISVTQFQSVSASSEPPSQRYYLLLLDRASGELTVVAEGDALRGEFAGDGRSLIFINYGAAGGIWSLDRYDIAQKRAETLIQYPADAAFALPTALSRGSILDWSADGQWLLILRDGFLILLAPAYDYKQIIIPGAPGCFNAAWVNSH